MAAKVQIPVLQPKIVLGLQTNIKGNIHFISDEEVVYPVANVLAFHNFSQNRQKIIKLSDKSQQPINLILVSPNKKVVALCEKGDKPIIVLYDTGTLKKRKIIGIPAIGEAQQAKEFVTAQFSMDSKYLMAVTGDPDWMLYCYNWEKGKTECFCKALNPNGTGNIVQLACNPTDPTTVALVGNQLLRLLMISESVFRQWGFSKADLWNLTCCCWLSQERFLAGSVDGMIHFIESGEYKLSFRAYDTNIYNFKVREAEAQSSKTEQLQIQSSTSQGFNSPVEFLVPFSKGFCYVCMQGLIHLFEKNSPFKYVKRNVFKVPDITFQSGPEFEKMTRIHSIAINFSEYNMVVTTPRSQIYHVKLWGADINVQPETLLTPIGASLHHGPITHIAVCAWKPIFITCGEMDRSLRIWNYELETLLYFKEYNEDIHSVALHPTGLYAIVGFSDKLRYMLVRIDDIEAQKEFSIRYCKQCSFSSHGHMFAAVNGTVIQIYSTISFDNLYNLKGHNGRITGLSWSAYDLRLSTCGLEGAIYEWDLSDPEETKRNSEYITKSIPYTDCSITMDGKGTFAVGIDGNLKYIENSVCLRDINIYDGELNSLAKARSDQMMFVASCQGIIYSLKFPLGSTDIMESNEYKIHSSSIRQIRLTYDDKTIISVASSGAIIIWKILFTEGKLIKLDKEFSHSDEILVGYGDLEEKLKLIRELTTRLHEMEAEHEYQLRTIETTNSDNVKMIHSDYNYKIDELKEKIQNLETDHIIEINNINGDIEKMKNGHEQLMQSQELMFNEKLIIEYDKYSRLEDKLSSVRKSYNKQIEDLQMAKENEAKDLIENYTMQLKDKDIQIEEIHEEMKQLIREHELIKQQIEDDADREILELKSAHEAVLREEQQINVKLRSDTMITRKKFLAANKEMDELRNTVSTLQDDHTKFKQIINGLESDIEDLKREIVERDQTIQDKEKRIHELKRKNQELEKFRFVLDYKIKDLKSQIEPKEQLISEQKLQIDDMIVELQNLQKKIRALDIQITELREKLHAADNEIRNEHQKLQECKAVLRRMQIDLHNATGLIQEPIKLKMALKEMYHRYNQGRDFQTSQMEDSEAKNEFLRQRQYLERTVRGLKKASDRKTKFEKVDDKMRVVDQSTQLIMEANTLRKKYTDTLHNNLKMESILGINSKFMGPTEAQERLNNVVQTRDEIHDIYKKKITVLERNIKSLKEENLNLLHKLLMHKRGQQSEDQLV